MYKKDSKMNQGYNNSIENIEEDINNKLYSSFQNVVLITNLFSDLISNIVHAKILLNSRKLKIDVEKAKADADTDTDTDDKINIQKIYNIEMDIEKEK